MRGSSNLLPSRPHARYIARAVDTEIIQTNTPELFAEAILRAAATLRRGELVAVPTETVYGLAANALETDCVEKIFEAKQRPQENPIIVHVASESMACDCVAEWPAAAAALAAAGLLKVLSRSRCHWIFISPSAIRSCGRRGPASDGSIVAISNSTIWLKSTTR